MTTAQTIGLVGGHSKARSSAYSEPEPVGIRRESAVGIYFVGIKNQKKTQIH